MRQRRAGISYWLLPGGGVERGETLADALEREIGEECGLVARLSGPPLAIVQTVSPDAGLTRHLIHVVFPAEVPESTPTSSSTTVPPPGIDPAIQEIGWFERAAVRDLAIHPPIQELLVAWLDPNTGIASVPPAPCLVTPALWAPE